MPITHPLCQLVSTSFYIAPIALTGIGLSPTAVLFLVARRLWEQPLIQLTSGHNASGLAESTTYLHSSRKTLDTAVYPGNRQGVLRLRGRVSKRNPAKPGQIRSKITAPRKGITPYPKKPLATTAMRWPAFSPRGETRCPRVEDWRLVRTAVGPPPNSQSVARTGPAPTAGENAPVGCLRGGERRVAEGMVSGAVGCGDRYRRSANERKNYQTKPISYNPRGIKGLRLISSTAGQPARQDPTDRSSGTRNKRTPLLKAGGPEGPQQGSYGLSEERRYRATRLPNKPNLS